MTVYLVGAGPGDPELLTIKALRLIRTADVVIHDRLVHPLVLALARPETVLVDAGKRRGRSRQRQERILGEFVRYRDKRTVVRLKGGDPYVFGRGGEEADFLRRRGIPFQYVPGVTSAVAAPGVAGVPVTHRKSSSSVTIVTAVGDYPWPRIDPKRPPGTLIVLMGAEGAHEVAAKLLTSGFSPRTKVAAIRNATYADQSVRLLSLAALRTAKLVPPTVLAIGAVAGRAETRSASRNLPLTGLRIAVVRAKGHIGEAGAMLRSLGARPVEVPVVAIRPSKSTPTPPRSFDALVFTSPEGVRVAVELLASTGNLTKRSRVFAIGPRTAREVRELLSLEALVPSVSNSRGLGDLIVRSTPAGSELLAFRSSAATRELGRIVAASGRRLVELPVYDLLPIHYPSRPIRAADVVITMAASCSKAIARPRSLLAGKTVVAIGPQAARPLRDRRDIRLLVAERHTLEGVVATLLRSTWAGVV